LERLTAAAHGLSRRCLLQGGAALAGVGLVSGCGAVPPQAQPPKVRRIGLLDGASAGDETQFARFRDRLGELGYVEALGRDLAWLDELVQAKAPARLPVVLTPEEARTILSHVSGPLSFAGEHLGESPEQSQCSR
jgi:hypothetical protein